MEKRESTTEPDLHRQASLGEAFASRRQHKRRSSRLRFDAAAIVEMAATSDTQIEQAPARFVDVSVTELGSCLRGMAAQSDLSYAEFLEAIARFDELEGWRASGARNCAQWMIAELGYSRSPAYRDLKWARELRELPTIAALFASGKLSWWKVKSLLRVATPEDERGLAIASHDLDADGVERLCDEYRFGKDANSDAGRDKAQHERRSLTWSRCEDGSIAMHVVLPPEAGADVIRCLEHREELLFDGAHDKNDAAERPSAPQRRADALVAMAIASLPGQADCAAGRSVASSVADRHLVVTHVDVEALVAAEQRLASEPANFQTPVPSPLRAAIAGILGGSISPATARRPA